MKTPMQVHVIRAWPHRHELRTIELDRGATVATAVAASGLTAGVAGYAIFGERVSPGHVLHEGDRVELLGPLQVDPRQARRRRAASAAKDRSDG